MFAAGLWAGSQMALPMRPFRRRRLNGGFTYVAMLALLAAFSIGMGAVAEKWHHDYLRGREAEIIRVGIEYAEAISHYYRMSPGGQRSLPDKLDALVSDVRGGTTVRHLRKLYPDPTMPTRPWQVVRNADGRIVGVFISSDEHPVRTTPLTVKKIVLPVASEYRQWLFIPALDNQ